MSILKSSAAIKKMRKLGYAQKIVLLIISIGIAILAARALYGPLLYQNMTASAPIGLYYVVPGKEMVRGDYFIVSLPADLPALKKDKGYLLLKRAAAFAGERYTVTSGHLAYDGCQYPIKRIGSLPQLKPGIYTVPSGNILFLNDSEYSMDSRYLGPIAENNVVAHVQLLADYEKITRFLESLGGKFYE